MLIALLMTGLTLGFIGIIHLLTWPFRRRRQKPRDLGIDEIDEIAKEK